ncbi:MAG: hypothetical protein JWQ87_3888 [Candidatus Sulfotelmatobacter sp.]|nr:hypothetical protein [Candidatus Sulfotelmatobacter sp.]
MLYRFRGGWCTIGPLYFPTAGARARRSTLPLGKDTQDG